MLRNDLLNKKFEETATKVGRLVGSPHWFFFSIIVVLIWIPSGLFLGFGEIWHLIINTTTTILTFLMMSLLHASQSRWEKKMEKWQEKEVSEIRAIKEEEKISSLH